MRWKILILLSFIIFIGVTPVGSTPLEWGIPREVCFYSTESMDLMGGPEGIFHMMRANDSAQAFYYSQITDTVTYSQLVESFASVGSMFCAVNMWGNMPYTVYRHSMDQNMRFTSRVGSTWTSPSDIPETTDCYFVETDMDPDGTIHVAWVYWDDAGDCHLMHSLSDTPEWSHHVVFTIGEHTFTRVIDMRLDSNNIAHFVWFDPTHEVIGYAVEASGGGYDISSVRDVETCRWIKIDFVSPDLPVIGYIQGLTQADSSIHYALKLGSDFSHGVVLDTYGIAVADMVINREDTITTTQWYFIVSLSTGIYYMYPVTGGWELLKIEELYGVSTNVSFSADWNSSSQTVGLAISDFTNERVYFVSAEPAPATPTPTPEPCTELGCKIEMPAAVYHTSDLCYCRVTLCNPGPKSYIDLPVFVIMDVYGAYYFAPAFSDYDHYTIEMFPAGSIVVEVLPEFNWPADTGSASGIHFYAGMTDREITELIGEYDMFTFGWSE
ncbi:hypothetical protein K8T06_02145 [bacterium]|nr:hypothetical protein [bacterium]